MSSDEETFQAERLRILTERAFGNGTGNAAFLLMGCVVMYPAIAASRVPVGVLLAWWIPLALCVLWTLYIEGMFEASSRRGSLPRQVLLRRRLVAGATTMLCFGMAPFLALREFTVVQLGIMGAVYSASVTISSGVYSLLPRYYLTLAVCAVGPLIVASTLRGEKEFLMLAGLVTCWLVLVLGKSISFSARELSVLEELVRLRLHARKNVRVRFATPGRRDLRDWLSRATARARARDTGISLSLYRFGPNRSLGGVDAYFAWDAIVQEAKERLRGGVEGDEMIQQTGATDLLVLYVDVSEGGSTPPAAVLAALQALAAPFASSPEPGGKPSVRVGVVHFTSTDQEWDMLIEKVISMVDEVQGNDGNVAVVPLGTATFDETTVELF